jgi:hypothetical protein
MKKKTTQRRAKAAVAATLMAMPMLSSPGVIYGQKGTPAPTEVGTNAMIKTSPDMYLKYSDTFIKLKGDLWLAGVGDGHTIYEKSNGEMFYIDTKTGDMKEVSADAFHKGETKDKKTNSYEKQHTYIKFDGIKGESKVKLLGVDSKGNVVHQKPNGEKFIVDENDGHVTVLK